VVTPIKNPGNPHARYEAPPLLIHTIAGTILIIFPISEIIINRRKKATARESDRKRGQATF